MRLRPVLVAVVVVLGAGPVLAAEPSAQAPVATAAQPSVAEQIDAYLKSSPVREIPSDGIAGVVTAGPERDRKVHGEVAVGIGSHGYRSVYLRAEGPLGESSHVSLAFEDTKFRGRYAPFDAYGGGLALGEPGYGDRRLCDLQGMTPSRPLDVTGGPHGRCLGRLRAR